MPHAIATRRVLYEIPGMESISPRPFEFAGADGAPLAAAIYVPASTARPAPAVILVEGYPDPGFARFAGCRFMDMQWSISMAQLLAASGIAAITYANRQPSADAHALIDHLTAHNHEAGLDGSRLGLWATSGHAPVALSVLPRVDCAVLTNPYTVDIDDATHVRDAAATFKFEAPGAAPAEGKPLFVVRSGKDEMPGLNASLDRFVAWAWAGDHPLTIVNVPGAPHAFELFADVPGTRRVLRQALAFLGAQLWE